MGLVTVSREDFGKPEFLVAIRKPVAEIKDVTGKLKAPLGEMRQILLRSFYKIFALCEKGTGRDGKVLYGLSPKEIGLETGYSAAMVGNYKTLYENQSKVVTIGQTAMDIEENEQGEIVKTMPEPIQAKVSDIAPESDIADLARLVRNSLREGKASSKGRPAATPQAKGDRQARTVISWTPDQRKAWLKGFCKTFVQTGQYAELHGILEQTQAHATRRTRAVAHEVETETMGQARA